MSSRTSDQQQRRTDSRTLNVIVMVWTAGVIWSQWLPTGDVKSRLDREWVQSCGNVANSAFSGIALWPTAQMLLLQFWDGTDYCIRISLSMEISISVIVLVTMESRTEDDSAGGWLSTASKSVSHYRILTHFRYVLLPHSREIQRDMF